MSDKTFYLKNKNMASFRAEISVIEQNNTKKVEITNYFRRNPYIETKWKHIKSKKKFKLTNSTIINEQQMSISQ